MSRAIDIGTFENPLDKKSYDFLIYDKGWHTCPICEKVSRYLAIRTQTFVCCPEHYYEYLEKVKEVEKRKKK